MLNIAFRADGGKDVGMGHIMRCLSLAKDFQRNGHKVYFFSKFDAGIEKVSSENFEVIQLTSVEQKTEGLFYDNPDHLATEANEIIALLIKLQIDVLLIDTYNVSEEYFMAVKSHVKKLAYIDDVNKFSYPVDIIINGNITGEYQGYNKNDENQVLLLGTKYNMIRDEFRNLPSRTVNEKVKEIMITTGGSDPFNLTAKFLILLLKQEQLKNLRLNVLVGSGFTNCIDLINIRQRHDQVFLYANSPLTHNIPGIIDSKVSAIMLRSDLAISAGGSTLYEFAACGTPVLAFILADNQEFIVEKMDELGYVKSLGWYNQLDEYTFIDELLGMMNDYQWRKKMNSKGQKLVDGKGAERIVRDIIQSLAIN